MSFEDGFPKSGDQHFSYGYYSCITSIYSDTISVDGTDIKLDVSMNTDEADALKSAI